MPGSLPSFSLPTIIDNPSGWGPSGVPDDLSNIPYAPYSKSDRLGKIADWAAPPETRNMGQYQQGQGQQSQGQQGTTDANAPFERRRARFGAAEAFGSGTASAFMYQHAAEEEASFSVVDRGTTTVKKAGGSGSGGGGGGFKTQRGGRGGLSRGFGGGQGGGSRRADGSMDNRQRGFNSRGGGFAGGRRRYGYNDKPQRVRDSSVKVGPEWSVMEEMEFTRLNKLHYIVDEPEDV